MTAEEQAIESAETDATIHRLLHPAEYCAAEYKRAIDRAITALREREQLQREVERLKGDIEIYRLAPLQLSKLCDKKNRRLEEYEREVEQSREAVAKVKGDLEAWQTSIAAYLDDSGIIGQNTSHRMSELVRVFKKQSDELAAIAAAKEQSR